MKKYIQVDLYQSSAKIISEKEFTELIIGCTKNETKDGVMTEYFCEDYIVLEVE